MEDNTIKISICRNNEKNLIIESNDGNKIEISNDGKELKASDVVNFLNYENDKKYELHELDNTNKTDKYCLSIYKLFSSIIEKLNLINN